MKKGWFKNSQPNGHWLKSSPGNQINRQFVFKEHLARRSLSSVGFRAFGMAPIKNAIDFKGRNFAFVEKATLNGRYFA
ncbi:MAG: hypothetical protein ACLQHF_13320 [Terracidiphilus sp.]